MRVRGACPPPFITFTITIKVAVYAPAEWADTLTLFHLLKRYILCGPDSQLLCSLADRYDNPMPTSTLSPLVTNYEYGYSRHVLPALCDDKQWRKRPKGGGGGQRLPRGPKTWGSSQLPYGHSAKKSTVIRALRDWYPVLCFFSLPTWGDICAPHTLLNPKLFQHVKFNSSLYCHLKFAEIEPSYTTSNLLCVIQSTYKSYILWFVIQK